MSIEHRTYSDIPKKVIEIKNEITISYFEQGSGLPVIMLPGWPVGAEMYLDAMKCFDENDFHLLAVDLPGWGKSSSLSKPETHNYDSLGKFVHDLMSSVGISRTNLIGVSFGAGLALHFAAKYPDMVNRVVANSPPIDFTNKLDIFQRKLLSLCDLIPGLKWVVFNLLMNGDKKVHEFIFKDSLDENNNLVRYILGELRKSKPELKSVDDILHQIVISDLKPILNQVKAPVLLLTGTEDYLKGDSSLGNELIPNSKLVTADGERHMFVLNNPQRFSRITQEFLLSD